MKPPSSLQLLCNLVLLLKHLLLKLQHHFLEHLLLGLQHVLDCQALKNRSLWLVSYRMCPTNTTPWMRCLGITT